MALFRLPSPPELWLPRPVMTLSSAGLPCAFDSLPSSCSILQDASHVHCRLVEGILHPAHHPNLTLAKLPRHSKLCVRACVPQLHLDLWPANAQVHDARHDKLRRSRFNDMHAHAAGCGTACLHALQLTKADEP
jgi:hypothetical protein